MRSSLAFRLGRQQIETGVNLKSIRADDFSTATMRDFGRELRLPHRRGADNEKRALHCPSESKKRETGSVRHHVSRLQNQRTQLAE